MAGEGFVSPSNLPPTVKFLVSATLGLALIFYLTRKPAESGKTAVRG